MVAILVSDEDEAATVALGDVERGLSVLGVLLRALGREVLLHGRLQSRGEGLERAANLTEIGFFLIFHFLSLRYYRCFVLCP